MAVSAAVIAALTGCASESPAPMRADPVFANALEQARASTASDAQLAILDRVAQAGSVELADVREALEGTYACLDAAGISHTEEVQRDRAGVEFIVYVMSQRGGSDDATGLAVSDQCALENSLFVEDLYNMQPSVVEAQEEYRANVLIPAMLACYEEYEVPIEEGLSDTELWDEGVHLIQAAPSVRPGDPNHAGCVYGAMLNWG